MAQTTIPTPALTSAAREVRDDHDASAPYGFSTRVAALAFAQERPMGSVLERFALRAVGLAALLAVSSVALNYDAFSTAAGTISVQENESELIAPAPTDDAVAIVLDLTD